MSQSPNNQIVAVSTTAVAVTAPQYYDRIIVTNETTDDIYVSTNGQVVTKATGGFACVVLPGAWRMIGNDQPRQPLVTQAEGSTVQNTGYQGSTTPNLNPLASGHPTYVSLIANVAGNVSVEFV